MRNIRLIVSDLDGTLLSEDHHLTDEVVETIQRFVEQGGLFTFATGRPYVTSKSIVNRLNIEIPYILCNGSVVAQQDKMLEMHTAPVQLLASFLIEADQLGLTVLLFREKDIFSLQRTSDVAYFEIKEDTKTILLEREISSWTSFEIQKVIIIGDMTQINRIWERHKLQYSFPFTTFQTENNYFEIIPGNHSKGAAMLRIMKLLDIRPDEVMAIGNQLNDIEMIRYAGVGVAVSNSHAHVKHAADYVCRHSYGKGVMEAMNKHVSIFQNKSI